MGEEKSPRPSLHEGAWSGQSCYVIGGGPSLKDFRWDCLKPRKNVIAINRAFLDCPWADVFFTEDLRVIELYCLRPEWKAFQGVRAYHALSPDQKAKALALDPDLFIIERQREDKFWSKRFADGLSLSSNSMIGALNMVDILGADPIFILGLDCNRTGGKVTNYHPDYERAGFERTGDDQYESFASDFKWWAALHLREKQVYNLNKLSAVDCWPKLDRDIFFLSMGAGLLA